MVYYFSLRSNAPIVKSLSQAELSAIERISVLNGIHVRIELIQYGAIIYLDDTFPKERFFKFKKIYLQNTQIYDTGHLPQEYMIWHDSLSEETIYFGASVEQYLQNKLLAIREFIDPKQGETLMGDIYKRIVKK